MTQAPPWPIAVEDLEATVLLPRTHASPGAGPVPVEAWAVFPVEGEDDPVGMNALVAAAAPLLDAAPGLRRLPHHDDPAGLREGLLRGLAEFERRGRAAGCAPDHLLVARYALCTMLDEAVAATPWGSRPEWVRRSLLVSLHRESFGGETFFRLLDKALEQPRRHRDLLELMHVCLALGFEGRYRVLENGPARLALLRARLHSVIRRERGEFERELSCLWKGVRPAVAGRPRGFPAGWFVSVAVLVLVALQVVAYRVSARRLASEAEPVLGALAAIHAEVGGVPRMAAAPPSAPMLAPVPAAPLRLRTLLAQEILADQLDVSEDAGRSRVVIHGDGLFDPGGAELRPELLPLIRRIADAMVRVPGVVTVSGHTDDRPVGRWQRFASNRELSLARARGVAELLGQTVRDHAIEVEGLADSRPLASNATAAGRARNRRVEITLRSGG